MTDEKELRELCERIGRLSGSEQTRLLEMVLAENRRRYAELRSEALATDAAVRVAEIRRREASQPTSFPPESKREAG